MTRRRPPTGAAVASGLDWAQGVRQSRIAGGWIYKENSALVRNFSGVCDYVGP